MIYIPTRGIEREDVPAKVMHLFSCIIMLGQTLRCFRSHVCDLWGCMRSRPAIEALCIGGVPSCNGDVLHRLSTLWSDRLDWSQQLFRRDGPALLMSRQQAASR